MSEITEITIPDGVTEIGEYAFSGLSGLTEITISDSVIKIGNNAFAECSSLENITLSQNIKKINNAAFAGCYSLKKIDIPDGVTSIGDYAFNGCGKCVVTLPDSVKEICEVNAFYSDDQQIIYKGETYAGFDVYNLLRIILSK